MITFKTRYSQFVEEAFKFYLLMLFIFTASRLLFMFRYVSGDAFLHNANSLPLMFFNGFRYDSQAISYFLIFPVFYFLGESVINLFIKQRKYVGFSKFNFYFFFFSIIAASIILIIDNIFYANFNTHISIIFFDFLNENPLLLLKTMWLENHLGWILLVLVFWGYVVSYFLKHLLSKGLRLVSIINYLALLFFPLLILSLRGNIGTFPLRLEDCYVSINMEINSSTPNGIFMLINALKDKRDSFVHLSPESSLDQAGFKSIDEAFSVYFEQPVDKIREYPIEHWLFPHTSIKNIKPVNVVLILTESWSNHLIEFNRSTRFDLLGPMNKHLHEDILFRNFQSSGNCTIDCVEMVSLNSPYSRLFTSKYKHIKFPTSIALPFDAAGYNSEFITGIDVSWRNLYTVLPKQGFKRVVGKYDIIKERPESKINRTWGVYDHDMLGYVANRLSKSKTPQFYMCLTSTSHTPFQFPPDFQLSPLILTDSILHCFSIDKDESMNYLVGFQYESWALGKFMDWLKASPLKDNTVVVITGDHNIRKLIDYSDSKFANLQYSVPLYLYLPPAIRQNLNVDESVFGSHSDILTTLAPLLLSDVPYFALGQNLFDPKLAEKGTISINQMQIIHSEIVTDKQAVRKAKARETILKWLFGKVIDNNKLSY